MSTLGREKTEPNLAELKNVSILEDGARSADPIHAQPIGALQIEHGHLAVTHLNLRVLVRDRLVVDPDIEPLVAPDAHRCLAERELRAGGRLAKNHEPRWRLTPRLGRG